MADTDVKQLLLQVDASIELLRRNLAQGDAPMAAFEGRARKMASSVEASIDDMGKRFGPFAQLARDAAKTAQESFESSFSEVQKLAARAVTATPSKSGSISIGAGDARAAADEAQRQAVALSLVAEAAERAALGEGVMTRETQLYLQAARAAQIEAEQHANELTREAGALERLEIEFNSTGQAVTLLANRQRAAQVSSGQLRAASQQLSYQISDVATSFAGGINPMVIFAQQSSQVIQAISLMKAESTGLIGFLGGPWGAAILGAISILGVMASKHDDAADAMKKHKTAAEELQAAIDALNDAAKREAASTRQGIADQINATNAMRLREIQTRKTLVAQLELAQATAKVSVQDQFKAGQEGGVAAVGISGARVDDLKAQIAEQDKKIASANLAIVNGSIKIAQRDVAAQTDRSTAANQRYQDTEASLNAQRRSGTISGADYRQQLSAATRQRQSELEQIREDERNARKHGPSDETLAKRAEAARQKMLSDDIAFGDEERQARHKLLDATRRTSTSEDQRDALLKEDINAEADTLKKKYDDQASKGQISKAERDHLVQINEATRQQRLQNVDIERARDQIKAQYDGREHGIETEIAVLRIQQDMATTNAERLKIARELLAKEQEERRLRLEKVRDTSDDPKEVVQAKTDLAGLPKIEGAENAKLDKDYRSPIQRYRDELVGATGDINEALQDVEVRGFQSLEDGILGVISGTESLGSAFKRMTLGIIADLARIEIEKAILGTLGNATGGGIFSGLSKLFGGGKAVGGNVNSDQFYLVGEDGPELFAPGRSGTIVPNGALRAPNIPDPAKYGASSGHSFAVTVDARGATDPAQVEAAAQRAVLAAAPALIEAAKGNTVSYLQRPKLPGFG